MRLKRILATLFIVFSFTFSVTPIAMSVESLYKVGDNCQDVDEVDYPKGLWCALDIDGNFTFWEMPYQLDDASVAILTKDIEGVDCTKTETRADCESLARSVATETIVSKLNLTKSQAESILSCYRFDGFSEPLDFINQGIYLDDGPWESGAPRFCYWYKYPDVSAAQRFNNLDGGAKLSIIFFVFLAIVLFIILYGAFDSQDGKKGIGSLSARTGKTLLAMVAFALVVVFCVWIYVSFLEPLFSGTKIDLSKKVFGVPQYMLPIIYGVYFMIWNSKNKK
jgi:hypothetical protein